MSDLGSTVRGLLDAAAEALPNPRAAAEITRLRARMDEPLRVALVGRVKAGKSTLLNALVGERLAPTDAGECTRIVTWYRYDAAYRVTAWLTSGGNRELAFSRNDGQLSVQVDGDANDLASLTVGWPSSRLLSLTLVDTPGLGSLSPGVSEATATAIAPADGPGEADAVVYLLRHAHHTDVAFLEAFLGEDASQRAPVNSIAVLSRADEIGAGRLDAMESARRIAERYARDARVRAVASAVVPVAGLLAETAATLSEHEAQSLRTLAGEAPETLERMLLSADLFREPGVGPLTVELREDLLQRLGMFGLRFALQAFAEGCWTSGPGLSRLLLEASGLPALETLLHTRFSGRSRQLVARSVLANLRSIAEREHAEPGFLRAIEEVEAMSHEFAELRMLDRVWSGEARFSESESQEASRLTGPGSAAERAGCLPAAPAGEVRAAIVEAATRWRNRAGDPLTDRATAYCCETMARSYEGVFAALHA